MMSDHDLLHALPFGMDTARRGSLRGELFGMYVNDECGTTLSDKVPSSSFCGDSLWLEGIDTPSHCLDTVCEVPGSPTESPSPCVYDGGEAHEVPNLQFDAFDDINMLSSEIADAATDDKAEDLLVESTAVLMDDDDAVTLPTFLTPIPEETAAVEPVVVVESPSRRRRQQSRTALVPATTPTTTTTKSTTAIARRRKASSSSSSTRKSKASASTASKKKKTTRRRKGETVQRIRKRDGNRRAAKKFREKQRAHETELVESLARLEKEQTLMLAQMAIIREIISERDRK